MADDLEDLSEEEGEGNSKKKLYLIIGVAMVVLLLGSSAAMYFLLGGDETGDADSTEQAVEVEEEGEKIATYYEMKPEFILSLPSGGRFKQAQIGVQVFTYKPELVDYLRKNDPMLRHHLLNLLNAQDSDTLSERSGREKLQAAFKDKLVELIAASSNPEESALSTKVEQIYFTSFVLQ